MTISKVITDFSSSRYTDAELSIKSNHVVEQMTGNAAFPVPSPPLSELTVANNNYALSLTKVESGSREDTVIKNNYRKIVESFLKAIGGYVQLLSNGDEAIILSSGFDVNRKPTVVGPLAKASGLTIKAGDNKGTIVADCNTVERAAFYEFEYTEAPNTPNSIWLKKTSTKHKLLIDGLTSGKQYIFRVAGAGSNPSRNWSDEISSFVL